MDDLKVAVEEPRNWARRLTITVPADRVQRERDDVARTIAKRVKLPGFRKGKVPSGVIEKRYGPSIEQQALERLVGSAYREALEQKSLEPISQAEVGTIDYQPGNDLTFQVEFEVRPALAIERTGGFSVTGERATVTDNEVDRVVERLREEQAVWKPLEAAPADGDMAVVEITQIRGAAEEDEAAAAPEPRRYEVVIGEGQILPEIEETLRELSPGETRTRPVTVRTEREDGEVVESEQEVEIRLVEGKHPELPPVDDDFARSVGEFESVDDLRARVREDLEAEAEAEAERDVRRKLVDALLDANPFDVPDSMVERYLEGMLPAREGAEPERVAEVRQQARPAAERAIKRMLALEELAEKNGLRATEEEVDARLQEIAARNDRTPEQIRGQLQKSGRLDSLADEITETKVFDWLKSQSTIN